MIQSTAFGTITIDGRTYTSDVIILPDGTVKEGWWRQRGHVLSVDDVLALVDASPELIVIGTGVYGRMQPNADLVPFLQQQGIALAAAPNSRAMAIYNERTAEGSKIAAGFHLTC